MTTFKRKAINLIFIFEFELKKLIHYNTKNKINELNQYFYSIVYLENGLNLLKRYQHRHYV